MARDATRSEKLTLRRRLSRLEHERYLAICVGDRRLLPKIDEEIRDVKAQLERVWLPARLRDL